MFMQGLMIKKRYDVFKELLNANQNNTLPDAIIIKVVQDKTSQELHRADRIYTLSDPCDIRSPSASKIGSIGKVISLEKQVVNDYKTFDTHLKTKNPSKSLLNLFNNGKIQCSLAN